MNNQERTPTLAKTELSIETLSESTLTFSNPTEEAIQQTATEDANQLSPSVDIIANSIPGEVNGRILILKMREHDDQILNITILSFDQNEVRDFRPKGNCIGAMPFQGTILCEVSSNNYSLINIFSNQEVGPNIENDKGWLDGQHLFSEEE